MNAFVLLSTLVATCSAGLIGSPLGGLLGAGKLGLAGNLGLANGALLANGPILAGNLGAPVLAGNLGLAGAPILATGRLGLAKGIAASPIISPIAAPSVQYQARDALGNLKFGYRTPTSARKEAGNAYGGVVGSYEYIDANGIPQRTDYVADALGFRATATNLPISPVDTGVPPIDTGVAPEPVMDTPEVAAAKADFLATLEAAQATGKHKRSVASLGAPLIGAPVIATRAIAAPLGLRINPLGLGVNPLGLGVNTLGLGIRGLGINSIGLGW